MITVASLLGAALVIAFMSVSTFSVGITFNIESTTGQLISGWTLTYGKNSTDILLNHLKFVITFHGGTGCFLEVENEEQFSVVGTNINKDFQGINIVGYASDQTGSRNLTTFLGRGLILRSSCTH